jgi:hypothetical protein
MSTLHERLTTWCRMRHHRAPTGVTGIIAVANGAETKTSDSTEGHLPVEMGGSRHHVQLTR